MANGKSAKNKDSRIDVFLSGDFCPDMRPGHPVTPLLEGGQYERVFGRLLPLIADSDLSVLNLEAPLTIRRKGILKCGPVLKARPGAAAALRRAGFDAACLANNHIRDYGPRGVEDTLRHLKQAGLPYFGVGPDLERAALPLTLRRGGRRLALLAFAENEFTGVDRDGWGAMPLMPEYNCEQVSRAARNHDAVLVFVHGGSEFCPVPSPRMLRTYRALARAGATAVIGSHAHVPQGWEWHGRTPVFYSLGNFIFPHRASGNPPPAELWYRGHGVRLTLFAGRRPEVEIFPLAGTESGTVDRPDDDQPYLRYLRHLNGLLGDPAEHRRIWEAWCVEQGASRLDLLRRRAPKLDGETENLPLRSLAVVENLVRCEAHHDVLTTFLYLARTGRLARAADNIDRLHALQSTAAIENNLVRPGG